MNRYLVTAAVAAVALISAGQSNALTIFGAQYKGVVQTGFDTAGLFGGGDLTGKSYTEVFTINTALGGNTQTPTYEFQTGGSSEILPATVTATITINGFTKTVVGTYHSTAFTGQNPSNGLYQIFDSAESQSSGGGYVSDNFISGGITSTTGAGVPSTFSSYNIVANTPTVQPYASAFQFQTNGQGGSLVNSSGILTPLSATPEPLTWVLMMVGLGGMGIALRNRKRTVRQSATVAA